jgi:hypothetical protein
MGMPPGSEPDAQALPASRRALPSSSATSDAIPSESIAARPSSSTFCVHWQSRAGPGLLVLAFLLHPAVSKAALRLLACRPIGSSLETIQLRLVMDASIRCDDPAWTLGRLGLALPVLLCFSLGLPVGTAWALWDRRHRLEAPGVAKLFGFLFKGFRTERAFAWESVIMFRKLALAAVTVVLAASGATTQATAGLVVIMIFGGVHAWIKPFASMVVNRLEMASLLVSGITLFCAVFMGIEDSVSAGTGASLITVIIVVSNLAFLSFAGAAAFAPVIAACRSGSKARRTGATGSALLHQPATDNPGTSVANPLARQARVVAWS